MSQLEKEQKLAKQEQTISRILWIPVIVLLAVIPLLVKLSAVSTNEAVERIMQSSVYGDFFSQCKSVGIMIACIVILILLFLFFDKKWIKKDKWIVGYSLAIGSFLLISLLSASFSEYKDVAFWGMPDRAEGLVIIACYILMFFYSIYIFRKSSDYKYIIISLSILTVVLTVLGIFQYFGNDLLMNNKFLNKLILSDQYAHLADSMKAEYESGKVYGTLYHYNYMGSFGAMVVPIFATLTLFMKGYKKKIAFGFVSICSLFLLLGSTSRAGLVGLAISILFALILFGKVIIRKWKLTVPVVVVLGCILLGFNAATGGTIFQRIPTLMNDALGIFMPADESFDYKDHIPVKEITSQDGKTIVEMQQGSLVFGCAEGGLIITDENGEGIQIEVQDEIGTISDPRFSELQIRFIGLNEESKTADGMILKYNARECFILSIDQAQESVTLIDNYTYEPLTLEEAPYWGFEGKERLGSARGYIWSRSLPMLKETILLGKGPDTFALEFPQNDRLAKWWAYETPNMLVDKPHNLYLQIALNEGGLALIAFIVLIVTYIIDSLRLYGLKRYYERKEVIGIATTLGVVGYLGAGIFNDSAISVAPIFWILLGVGVAINYMNRKEHLESMKRLEHGTIDMKTKQYINQK